MPLIRHPSNPLLTRRDIPPLSPELMDVSSVFNPGAVKFQDKYRLLLRVQNRGRETFLLRAESGAGLHFTVTGPAVCLAGLETVRERIYHVYDPRLTVLEGTCYIMVALDLEGRCELGLARTNDFVEFEFLGVISQGDYRNGVLFPEKIGGHYLRLDRPNRTNLDGGVTTGREIWLSSSNDLLEWRAEHPVMSGRLHYWDELIGSGPPPVKTSAGWLHVYHGIATHFAASNLYQAGVVLLDLNDPSRVVARGRYNILEPRELYELTGQVPGVVFPSGMIVEQYDERGFAEPESEVKVYYGAADTMVCLATATVKELIEACYA